MSRRVGSVLLVLAFLLGQTSTAAMSASCCPTNILVETNTAAIQGVNHHHEHLPAADLTPDERGEGSVGQEEHGCMTGGAFVSCSMSACAAAMLPTFLSASVRDVNSTQTFDYSIVSPIAPLIPIYRPPIA